MKEVEKFLDELFQDCNGHPDELAVAACKLPKWVKEALPIQEEVRLYHPGYVLSDGDYIFPGDTIITRLISI